MTRPARETLAQRIVNGAVAQSDIAVSAASLRWPKEDEDSIVLNLYLEDRRIEMKILPEDLGVAIPEACNLIEDLTPFYWTPSTDPVERMRQIADSTPFNESPWLSCGGAPTHEW